MAFKDILLDIRAMRRSVKIRNETDPEKVAEILEQLVKESVHLQNAGDKGFQRKSLAELKQIRRDLVSGQINAGSKTGQMTAVYSGVIDSIEKLEQNQEKGFDAYDKTASALRNSIPSSDTLISALMTANPIVGYGVKMVRDLARSSQDGRRKAAKEAAARLKLLREQEVYLEEQFKKLRESEADANPTPPADGPPPGDLSPEPLPANTPPIVVDTDAAPPTILPVDEPKKNEGKLDIYDAILKEIRDDIKELVLLWGGTPSGGAGDLNPLNGGGETDPAKQAELDYLASIKAALDAMAAENARLAAEAITAAEELEEKRKRDAEIIRVRDEDTRGGPLPIVDDVDSDTVRDPDHAGGGVMGGIMKLLGGVVMSIVGGLSGLLAAFAAGGILTTLLKPFTAVLKFIGSIGRLAVSLGTKILLPLAVIKSIYDFFDAFFNADAFLKKNDSQISIGERISLGFANVIAKLVGLVDDLFELFDIDLFDQEGLTVKIHEFFMSVPKMVTDFLDKMWTSVTGVYTQVMAFVNDIPNKVTGMIDQLTSLVTGVYDDAVAAVRGKIDEIKKNLVESYEGIIEKVTGVFTSISDTFTSVIGAIESKLKDWKKSISNIPGLGSLFTSDDSPEIKLDENEINKASNDLKELTSSTNLLRLNDGVATMVPLETASGNAATGVQRAEQTQAAPKPSMMLNAPTNTTVNNVNNSTPAVSSNTGNQNHKFRRIADGTR